jgi:hypothetical protein
MAMKPGTNEAIIEGILSEKIVREFTEGPNAGSIAGELVIEVVTSIDGENFTSIIPVSFYATPMTKAGKPNSAYKGIKTIIDGAKSLAEVDGDVTKADCIRLRNGTLGENMFFAQDDRFVSFARIRGNFFDRVKETDCIPKAQFKVKMIVGNMFPETKKEGGEEFETGRLVVMGLIVQYNGTLDEVKFIVQNKKYRDLIEKNWNIGDTVNASGFIKYVTDEVTNTEEEEDGFGDPLVTTSTRRLREFIITGGSGGPVEGYDEDEIAAGRKERKSRIAEVKEKQERKEESTPKAKAKAARDW